jgi:hypothetical protein
MDTTTTVWWACLDCGVDVELAGGEAAIAVPCPDCATDMAVQWSWDAAA